MEPCEVRVSQTGEKEKSKLKHAPPCYAILEGRRSLLMRHASRFAAVVIAFAFSALAQTTAPSMSVAPSLLNGLQWRGIGPAATGGRIADIAVAKVPGAPSEIYVGTTTGG